MPSAISTPVFAAQNSNILNDGSADSPRGFGSVTSTGTFNITSTGPSLYRVVVATPAAPITAALPTTVKAGYRCRIEVELTGSTETNCFFTSPAIEGAKINGTGFVELMALVDNPDVAGEWKVVDVEENLTSAITAAATGANDNTASLTFYRRNRAVHAHLTQTAKTGAASSSIVTTILPVRCRPSTQRRVGTYVVEAGLSRGATALVGTSGSVDVILYNSANYSTSGNAGLFTSLSYHI
jgi:hypothetical protein